MSKGISEKVSKSIYVPLIQIDTFRLDGERNILIVQITGSGGVRVTERLACEVKHLFKFLSSIVLSTSA